MRNEHKTEFSFVGIFIRLTFFA